MIRIAIVGTGSWAEDHVRGYRELRGVKIVACCDMVAGKAEEFARRHGIPRWYSHVEPMFAREKLDAVSVAVSDAGHAAVSLAAMARGLAVLCEKPLATNIKDARRMVRAARRYGVVNLVNFRCREAPVLARARQWVAEGALGELRHVQAEYLQCWLVSRIWGDWRKGEGWLWRMSRTHGGGVLADVGCHILDAVVYVAGGIDRLSCTLRCFPKGAPGNRCRGYLLDANDSAVITAEFTGGATGTITATRWASGHANTVRLGVYGTKGGLEIDLDKSWTQLRLSRGRDLDRCAWKTVSCGRRDSMYARFVHAIRTGRTPEPTFEDGIRVQELLTACERSAQLGRWVSLSGQTGRG